MAVPDRRTGQTKFGSLNEANGVIAVEAKAGTGSGLILVQPDGTEKVLYVDNTGDLIIGTYAQFVAATGGVVAGTQT